MDTRLIPARLLSFKGPSFIMCSLALLAAGALPCADSRGDEWAAPGDSDLGGPARPALKRAHPPQYPDKARLHGTEGRALVEFSIARDGHAQNVLLMFADDPQFARAAADYLSGAQFDVPASWSEGGREAQRYRLGFVFCLPPSSQPDTFIETADTILVETTPVRASRAAGRHQPVAASSSRCMQSAPALKATASAN